MIVFLGSGGGDLWVVMFAGEWCSFPLRYESQRDWRADRSLGPVMFVVPRSTWIVYPLFGVPGDVIVIVPFWSVRYQGTPAFA